MVLNHLTTSQNGPHIILVKDKGSAQRRQPASRCCLRICVREYLMDEVASLFLTSGMAGAHGPAFRYGE